MSYTKTTWHTGDVVTSAKLNNAEAGIENAQWKTESSTQLFSESVTTASSAQGNTGVLAYREEITADTLAVTFNGTEYTCTKTVGSGYVSYGAVTASGIDFSEYPFGIVSQSGTNILVTEAAGTYTISTSAPTITPSETFTSEVAKATSLVITAVFYDSGYALDKTWQEIHDAFASGKNCPVIDDLIISNVLLVSSDVGNYFVRVYSVESPFYTDYTTDSADGYPSYSSGG